MTADQAMAIVREHGVVLASAKGPAPRLAELIAGESIKGSWWAHPRGHQIFAILQKKKKSPDILVCRLVNGKVTLFIAGSGRHWFEWRIDSRPISSRKCIRNIRLRVIM
jgi:hypothetical protein